MSCTIFHYRVYIEDIDLNVRKLYITRIEEGDAGIYVCKAVINNEDRWKNLTLAIFSKYYTVAISSVSYTHLTLPTILRV